VVLLLIFKRGFWPWEHASLGIPLIRAMPWPESDNILIFFVSFVKESAPQLIFGLRFAIIVNR